MSKMKLNPLASAIHARRWPYALAMLTAPGLALAGPSGGNVVAGQAVIGATGTTTTIQQGSASAVINWQDFDIGGNEFVVFNQPSASAAVLNKVVGGSPSEILGSLKANGRVFIVNPQGVLFGQGSQVNVGSLVATTMDIDNNDFMQGRYLLKNAGSGTVSNLGDITAAQNGFVVLAGQQAHNGGVISAQLGEVVLASGNAVTLDLDGNGLINISLDQASLAANAGVSNAGEIIAQGGRVLMTARTARGLAQAAVNNTGTIRAQGISERGGDIYLVAQGGDIANTGLLDVSGVNGQDGGGVMIRSDADIALGSGSTIDIGGKNGGAARVIASGRLATSAGSLIDGRADDQATGKGGFTELSGHTSLSLEGETLLGKGGMLLIDPTDICIGYGSSGGCSGGSFDSTIQQSTIESSLGYGTDVFIVASDSITVSDNLVGGAITSNSGASLTLGIGFIDAYAGPLTGGFGRSPLQSLDGNFINSAASTTGTGSILFQGSTTRDGINIGGDLFIKGATNKGDVTVGNITANTVGIAARGIVTTGDITVDGDSSTSNAITLASATALAVGNLTADRGHINLYVLHSDTASSVGNITVNGNDEEFGTICVNHGCNDLEYLEFSGLESGYAGYGNAAQAVFDLGSTAKTWSALSIVIQNADISGAALSLVGEHPFGGNVNLRDNVDIGTSTLNVTTGYFTAQGFLQDGVAIRSTHVSADTLNVTAGELYFQATKFSGSTGTLSVTNDFVFTGVYDSSFDYSSALSFTSASDTTISDSDFNSSLQVTQPGLITGRNVSITASDLYLSSVEVKAGVLNLTATAGELEIKGGEASNSSFFFNTGTLQAIAGEFVPRVTESAFSINSTESGGDGIGLNPFNGAVSIGDYSADPTGTSVLLQYGSVTINAEGLAFIENSTLSNGALTISAESYFLAGSAFSGTNATFTANGDTLSVTETELDPLPVTALGDFYDSYIGDSSFNYTGALSATSTRALNLTHVDINQPAGQLVAGRTVTLTGNAGLGATDLVVHAQTASLNAAQGHLNLIGGGFNVPSTESTPPALPANSSLSFNGQSVYLEDVEAHARTINVTSTLATAPLEAPIGSSLNSASLRFVDFTGTSANLFDIQDSTLTGNNVTVTANGAPQVSVDQNQNPILDAYSSVFSNSTINLTGGFSLTASHGVEFHGEGGESATSSVTANSIRVNAGTGLTVTNTVFSGVTGTFNAGAPIGGTSSAPAILVSNSGFGFTGLAAFNASGIVIFNQAVVLTSAEGPIQASSALSIKASDDIYLTDNTIRVADAYFETNDSLFSYGGDLTGASQLTLLAGSPRNLGTSATQSTGSGILYLGGNINGGNTLMTGANGVVRNGDLTISSNALDVAGDFIELSGSSIIVGNGIVASGDGSLRQAIATGDSLIPLPQSSGPNARFRAGINSSSSVKLGGITFSQANGDHLFVSGTSFDFELLSYNPQSGLFVNFTPVNLDQPLSLQLNGFGDAPQGLTVAIGSSTYLGNITVANSEAPTTITNGTNFVFATKGSVSGLESLSTNGRVLVTDAVASAPPAQVTSALNQVSNLQPETQSNNPSSTEGTDAAADAINSGDITIDETGGGEGNELECT